MEKNESDVAESVAAAAGAPKKDRHVVSWTPEEDDLLREQIALHGANNWTSIAAKFKDKTSRQCRRRWYTYLNSECKKGGWSPEEDMLLCEAQKILGNRWTEIAKVVSGRTDNAVKNRFSTLCKKRAKNESLYKENEGNKSLIIRNKLIESGIGESSVPVKQMRYDNSDLTEKFNMNERLFRKPLAELQVCEVSSVKNQGSFLKKSDPKFKTLLQQSELLSSLALRVNTESSKESLDDAWKQLQDYLTQIEENGAIKKDMLDDLKDLIDDLKSSKENTQSSPKSTGNPDAKSDLNNSNSPLKDGSSTYPETVPELYEDLNNEGNDVICNKSLGDLEFASPVNKIPPFHSFTDAVPSPKFSESERKFLMSVLGLSSPSLNPDCSKKNSCKRSLLDSL